MTQGAFGLLNSAACFLEIGILAAGLNAGQSLAVMTALLAFYHGGYLLVDYQSYNGWWTQRRWGIAALIVSPLILFSASKLLWPAALVPILVYSAAIHTARTRFMSGGGYTNEGKALFRLMGYLAGGISAFWGGLPLAILCLIPLLIITDETEGAESKWHDRFNTAGVAGLLLFIFFHHLQYFILVYSYLTIMSRQFSLPAFLVGGLMLMGWVGYNFIQGTIKHYVRGLIGVSHVLNGFILICMFLSLQHEMLDWSILCWFLSGILGGTVYTVELMPSLDGYGTKGVRNTAESLGHVGGAAISAWIGYLGGSMEALVILAVASTVAAGAASLIHDLSKERAVGTI